jgi:hypothetical protein
VIAGSKLQCAPKAIPISKLMMYKWPRVAYAQASAAAASMAAVMVRKTVRGVPLLWRYCSGT